MERNDDGQAAALGQICPRFQRATELIGKRWTGAIVRTLIGGPCRFNELLARVTGISDRLLSERLRELEATGLVKREVAAGPPVRVTYELTCSGHELEPVVSALEAWAEKWITLDPLKRVDKLLVPASNDGQEISV
jgi:DNA-binding HxlR family transcriptional regulator